MPRNKIKNITVINRVAEKWSHWKKWLVLFWQYLFYGPGVFFQFMRLYSLFFKNKNLFYKNRKAKNRQKREILGTNFSVYLAKWISRGIKFHFFLTFFTANFGIWRERFAYSKHDKTDVRLIFYVILMPEKRKVKK